MIIGITGGTGCGKTTFLNVIREAGGAVLDCDAIYHDLLRTDTDMLSRIAERFPGTVTDGVLDRKMLGSIVFADPAALEDLNEITHSAVKAEVIRALESKPALAAIDAIGLFESGLSDLCDITVAITAPREARISRLMARDGITRAYAEKRIDAQRDPSEFAVLCDHLLENNGTEAEFCEKCRTFLRNPAIL